MVSFKTNNCSSEHPVPHCHLPGTLRTPVSHCNNNYPPNQGHSHDRAPPSRCTASRTNYPAPPHGCALHPRLDQPVTSSTHAMDDKKVVQSAPSATPGQQVRVKSALDGTGVVASISGARRRSGPQGLRSPAAKRPLSAPVALQGWLHKQGSEGLMLWKKRWFVLSEYCLFYYKGPEEEKLLGSILLPSYRVTLCKPEDKVNKKFAFKAEHANMRTYHFAADTRESMNQWVNALTLATLLQDPNPVQDEAPAQEIAGPAEGEHSARPSVSSISSILNQSADDSDSGFHGFQSRDDPSQSNNNSSPNSVNTASFPNLSASNSNHGIASSPDRGQDGVPPLMNGWMQPPPQFGQPSTSQQFVQNVQPMGMMHQHLRQHHATQMASNVHAVQPMLRNFGQPVYANAPPKPRRLTDGTEYSTPSPDPEFRKSPVQPGARMTAKSPISDYDRGNVIYASRLAHQSTPPLRTDKSGLNYGYSQAQPAERRTPDTYGRSAKPRVSRANADYEDVYGAPQLYQRPPGPVGYSKGPAPVPISIPVYGQHQQQVCPVMPAVMRPSRTQPPPRPHSADFLEYEASRDPCAQGQSQAGVPSQPRRPQRPKSSMDVVGSSDLAPPGGDGYFYSEERYAAQMRQSSVYLHQTPQHHQQQRNQSLSRATTPSKSVARGEEPSNSMALNEISCPNSARKSPREQPVYRQHPMATQSLQRYTEASTNEAMVRRSLRERSYDPSFHDPLSHSESGTVPRRAPRDHESNSATSSSRLSDTLASQMTQSYHGNHSSARRWTDQQFARSASARLPRTRHPNALDHPDDSEYESRTTGQSPRDGEKRIQQREESMKRLLEWKQRMLQSPLTRKPSATANPSATAQSELSSYYRRQALLDLAAHEASITEARHSRRRDDSHRAHVRSKSSDGRRSVANVSRYNSYSSDDEASGSGSIIGRDPLPPRAVSTSQLAAQNPLTQPPMVVTTLPHARANGRQQSDSPVVHHPTPQARNLANDSNETGRVASDVPPPSILVNNESLSEGNQCLVSPRNLRVVSPIDHRVSSPSDSERHIRSSSERNLASPISMREMNGDTGSLRQMQRVVQGRESTSDLLHKRARLAELDAPRRLENLQKLEELKKHLMNLEKQYEKGKPLVNLVDNMVKLGSLYNRNGVNGSVSGSRHDLLQAQESTRERLEFNQRVQEQRLLAEERRDWDRLSPDHGQLQAKVQQLYKLDRLLQEESGTLHSLQQDKEILEKALGGLKYKLQGSRSNPIETERYRKQQILLERELSRVRMLLAHNSKKLEETVAENARLEQDLVVLRQKLQASRRFGGNMARDPSGTTATLEAELRRVQQLVGDLQRQRQDLSIQVRQLTEKSHSLVQQIKPNDLCNALPSQQLHHPKKRSPSSWLETDLDSGMTFDHGLASPSSSSSSMSPRNRQNGSPHQHIPSPQYKEPPSHGYSPTQIGRQPQSNHQPIYIQAYPRPGDTAPHNHISTLSPQLREQIQQHQLKQQLLKDQMQGKASPVQGAIAPLYINTDSRRINCNDPMKRMDSANVINSPPEYIPPPPPPPSDDVLMMNGGYGHHEDNKFPGLMHGREKPEIKTVRIVKRESERRQRDRGDRNGNIGIPLTNGLQAPGGAKRLTDEDYTSQQFEKTQLGRVAEETTIIHAQSTIQLSELDDVQFQRSMSLPRGFGGQRPQTGTTCGPVPPPPRSDSMNALRNMMARRHRVRFENQEASSDSTLSLYTDSPTSNSQLPLSSPNYSTSPSYSPSNQNYVSPYTRPSNASGSPGIHAEIVGSTSSARSASLSSLMSPSLMSPVPVLSAQERLGSLASINSLGESPQLSPVFKSEAAKQIIKEMTEKKTDGRRRPVPKEKRRHYTVSSSKPMLDLEDTFSKMGMGRARDDLDMERALRPRINAPDVVRSTLSHKELKYNESTIDQLLGTPNKIVIPERYIPEHTPELSAEEKKQRLKKADAIRKMLSETTVTTGEGDDDDIDQKKSNSLKKKVAEEKRQRDHILQLNQILAKQVMEKSKMVAAKALATLPLNTQTSLEDDDLSPVTPLPLYQQRENFYS